MRVAMQKIATALFGGREETAIDVLIFKIIEGYIVVRTVDYCLVWAAFVPNIGEVVLPLGIAEHIDISFMFDARVSWTLATLATVFLAAGFFRLNRFAYLGAFLLFHLFFAARFSLGEIPHSSNFVGVGVFALAIAPLVSENPTGRRQFAIGVLVFFIGLAYTTGAVSKLVVTGVTWSDGRHLWIWIAEKAADKYSEYGELTYLPAQRLMLDNWWLATLSLTFGLVSELVAFTFWFPRARPWAASAILVLHTGIYMTMRIMFSASMHLIALVGFPWSKWIAAASPRTEKWIVERLGGLLDRIG